MRLTRARGSRQLVPREQHGGAPGSRGRRTLGRDCREKEPRLGSASVPYLPCRLSNENPRGTTWNLWGAWMLTIAFP